MTKKLRFPGIFSTILVLMATTLTTHAVAQPSGIGDAADSGTVIRRESVEIKPYTGPPIYLDESEPPPPPTVAERQVAIPPVKYPDGTIQIERQVTRYSDDRLVNDGFYREYFPTGNLFVEGTYREAIREGEWTYYYDNGQKNRTVTYVDGMPNGSWDVFRPDGTLSNKRGFKNGMRHGEWMTYDESGEKPLEESHFDEGKPVGEWKVWFKNGVQKSFFTFKDGIRDGPAAEWDEEGTKRVEVTYKQGKLHGVAVRWTADGTQVNQTYEDGRLVSEDLN